MPHLQGSKIIKRHFKKCDEINNNAIEFNIFVARILETCYEVRTFGLMILCVQLTNRYIVLEKSTIKKKNV